SLLPLTTRPPARALKDRRFRESLTRLLCRSRPRVRSLEPAMGVEPATFRLQIGCSTVELRRRRLAPGPSQSPYIGRHSKIAWISRARTGECSRGKVSRSGVFHRETSLPHGLVSGGSRGCRYVQGSQGTPHRKPGQNVTPLANQPAHPPPFGPENQGQVAREV